MLLVWLLAARPRDCGRAAARPHELPRDRRPLPLGGPLRGDGRDPLVDAPGDRSRGGRPPAPRQQAACGPRGPGGHRLPDGRSGRPAARGGRLALAAVDQPRRGGYAPPRVGRTARLVTHRGGQAAAARTGHRGENQPSGLRRGAGGGLPLARVPGHGLLLRRRGAAPRPSGRRGTSGAGLRGGDPRPGARPRAPGFGGRAPARPGGTRPERRSGPRPGAAGSTASPRQAPGRPGPTRPGGVAPRAGRG